MPNHQRIVPQILTKLVQFRVPMVVPTVLITLQLLIYDHKCDRICKRSLQHTYKLPTSTIYNFSHVKAIGLKFLQYGLLTLRKLWQNFQTDILLQDQVMVLQSHTSLCVWKTPFRKSCHKYFEYFIKLVCCELQNTPQLIRCYNFKTKFSVIKECILTFETILKLYFRSWV